MTEPPKLDHLVVSASEMEAILEADIALQKLIDRCRTQDVGCQNIPLPPGVTKQTITRYLHETSGYEVALKSEYEKEDGSKLSFFSRLRVKTTVYERDIP